jgi:hypothetical protein
MAAATSATPTVFALYPCINANLADRCEFKAAIFVQAKCDGVGANDSRWHKKCDLVQITDLLNRVVAYSGSL